MDTENNQAPASDTTRPSQSPSDDLAELDRLVAEKRRQIPQPEPAKRVPVESATSRLSRIAPPVDPEAALRMEAERKDREERARSAERTYRWRSLVNARGARYESCRLENFTVASDGQRVAVERLKDCAENIVERISDGMNVVLIGPAGTGKDHLLMALCHAAIGAFRSVEWRNGTSLWLEFRKTIGEDEDESRVARRLVAPDVLAISDPVPPRGPLSDYQAAMLFDVVDSRYSSRKPTWVTLNCASREEAEERIGAQVVDRLAHDALVVKCNWSSYRKGQA